MGVDDQVDSLIGTGLNDAVPPTTSAPLSNYNMPTSTVLTAATTPERGAPKLRMDGSQVGMTASELSTLVREEAEKMVRQIMEAKEKEAFQLQVQNEEDKRLREEGLKVKENSQVQRALSASLEDVDVMSPEQRRVVEMAMLSPSEVAAKKARLASEEEN